MDKSGHILDGSAALLGITLAILAGLKVSNSVANTYADEIGGISAVFLTIACVLSYLALRSGADDSRWEKIADYSFLIGLATLVASMVTLMQSTL